MSKTTQNQIKTQSIEVRYSDGQKIVIRPYKLTQDYKGVEIPEDKQRTDYALEYFDKKGRCESHEGSWSARQLIDWFAEIIEDDNYDYDAAFEHIMKRYPTTK